MKLHHLLAAASLLGVTGGLAQANQPAPTFTTQQFAVAADGTPLLWDVFTPSTGSGPWPVVLVIHAGGFRTGVRGPQNVCEDLAAAGFAAAAIDYRLDARKNLLAGQSVPVFAPPAVDNQTLDIQAAVNAARHPTTAPLAGHVTGWVGAVGGSNGAAHALWVAATGTLGDTRVNAAALLSGSYQFDDSASLNNTMLLGCDMVPSGFRSDQTAYCQTSFNRPSLTALHAGSPVYQVRKNVSPLDIIATTLDPITPTQIGDLVRQLQKVRATNYVSNEMEGCEHSYNYWDLPYVGANPPETVGQQVINFLIDHLSE